MNSITANKNAILLESLDEMHRKSYCFTDLADEIVASNRNELLHAFVQLEKLQSNGLYLVGYINYESAYYLNDHLSHLRSPEDPRPLLHFNAYRKLNASIINIKETNELLKNEKCIEYIYDTLTSSDYQQAFANIHQALKDGNSYQINYTKRLQLKASVNSFELYQRLLQQQPVLYSAYLPFSSQTILSFSPELFFKKTNDEITVKPMKGTAPRFKDPIQDQASKNFLANDEKNKAENLIIVDLLRNDLASFCHSGSASVKKLFDIEPYKSVYQMTSTITAKLEKTTTLHRIIQHLFPCGSITGAPKKRTMEIIKHTEDSPRDLYTGAIGYIMPNNDMCFNVAIRTLSTTHKQNTYQLGVGGGFTIQSNSDDEWQEMETKLRFIKKLYLANFSLVESLYYFNQFRSLDQHLSRLQNSASCFSFDIDLKAIKQLLLDYCNVTLTANAAYKVRLELNQQGQCLFSHQRTPQTLTSGVLIELCPELIEADNIFWQHKTTHASTRGFYNAMHDKYIGKAKNKELIFANKKGHLTEGRFYNLIIKTNGKYITPPISDGLLPGVARRKFIKKHKAIEHSITPNDLYHADQIYLINDVRGLISATLAPNQATIRAN